MNSKSHFYISLAKSMLRIFGCAVLVGLFGTSNPIGWFAVSFGVAEILGIAEEVFDKR